MTAKEHRARMKARLRDKSMDMEARFVWMLIEGYADKNGWNAHPSAETLAQLSGKTRKWIFRQTAKLEAAGWIIRFKRRHEGSFSSTAYTVIYPPLTVTPKRVRGRDPKKGTQPDSLLIGSEPPPTPEPIWPGWLNGR